jgi:hypothetical protein
MGHKKQGVAAMITITTEEYDARLILKLEELTATQLFMLIPGCYEEIAEIFNNEILDEYAQDRANEVNARLEYLRGEIEEERISLDEICELQSLADHIDPGDTLLLEWAGVEEK